jgi:hypothetical protein
MFRLRFYNAFILLFCAGVVKPESTRRPAPKNFSRIRGLLSARAEAEEILPRQPEEKAAGFHISGTGSATPAPFFQAKKPFRPPKGFFFMNSGKGRLIP